jgi:hypothetical protein
VRSVSHGAVKPTDSMLRCRGGMVSLHPVIVDSFCCVANDLGRYRLESGSMWLRRQDDSDDPGTWRLVRTIRYVSFESIYDPGLPGVELITV